MNEFRLAIIYAIVAFMPISMAPFLPLVIGGIAIANVNSATATKTTTTTTRTTTTITALTTTTATTTKNMILTPDASDTCPMGYFHCNTTSQCVPQRLNCDGTADCDDASDEWKCVNEVDAKFWDHLFRKQPFGRHDDIPIGACLWPTSNLSCPCRGNEILCRFQQLTSVPANLQMDNVAMLDLTGNNFSHIDENFFMNLPMTESLVLKFCGIETIDSHAFKTFASTGTRTLYLDENRIEMLPEFLFPAGNHLKVLILSGNRIHTLHSYDFQQLNELLELDLRGNGIVSFDANVFEPLVKLEVLYLNENRIQHIRAGMFPALPQLHTLSLAHNVILDIERDAFTCPRLRHLFLAGNRLSYLQGYTFCPLHLLQGLHLNDNKLQKFDVHAFDCLENLTSLLLTGNSFRSLEPRILQNLTNLNYIYFSWFHLCRAALHVRVCEPRGDGISSKHHLLDNPIQRGSVWFMALIAILGNILVLVGRFFYKSRRNAEHSLYLRHLAASDLLMGIYLAIIAYEDIRYRGEYLIHDEEWRYSAVCDFSGFLNTFSCQSSTLLLTLVTWDRLMSVTRPLQPRDTSKLRIALRLLLLWSISFGFAAAPLLPFDYFGPHYYGSNGVCLSLYIHDPFAQGWEYSALLFIGLNTLSLIFIAISYVRMLQAIRDSGGSMRSTASGRQSVVTTRFAIIVTTDCTCWLPIIVVKVAALSGFVVSTDLYAWLAVLVLPVNSALNPILYTLTTTAFKQQLQRYCLQLPTCSHSDPRSHTQTAIESGLSTSLGHFGSNHSHSSGRRRSSRRHLSYV